MMTDVDPNFADIPGLFETLIMKKDIPLFLSCTIFLKMTATFKLYNLKAKNGWSEKSFDSLLDLLWEMLPKKWVARVDVLGEKNVVSFEYGSRENSHVSKWLHFIPRRARELE
jgi:hypothetical protein